MRVIKLPLIDFVKRDKYDGRTAEAYFDASRAFEKVEVSKPEMTMEEHQAKVDALVKKVREEAYEEAKMHFDAEKKEWTKDKPKDWAFMEQSGETLKHLPATWMRYPDTPEGMVQIIEMEYGEVMAAWKDGMGDEAVSHELVHLASACLHLWRRLNHAE